MQSPMSDAPSWEGKCDARAAEAYAKCFIGLESLRSSWNRHELGGEPTSGADKDGDNDDDIPPESRDREEGGGCQDQVHNYGSCGEENDVFTCSSEDHSESIVRVHMEIKQCKYHLQSAARRQRLLEEKNRELRERWRHLQKQERRNLPPHQGNGSSGAIESTPSSSRLYKRLGEEYRLLLEDHRLMQERLETQRARYVKTKDTGQSEDTTRMKSDQSTSHLSNNNELQDQIHSLSSEIHGLAAENDQLRQYSAHMGDVNKEGHSRYDTLQQKFSSLLEDHRKLKVSIKNISIKMTQPSEVARLPRKKITCDTKPGGNFDKGDEGNAEERQVSAFVARYSHDIDAAIRRQHELEVESEMLKKQCCILKAERDKKQEGNVYMVGAGNNGGNNNDNENCNRSNINYDRTQMQLKNLERKYRLLLQDHCQLKEEAIKDGCLDLVKIVDTEELERMYARKSTSRDGVIFSLRSKDLSNISTLREQNRSLASHAVSTLSVYRASERRYAELMEERGVLKQRLREEAQSLQATLMNDHIPDLS